MIKLPQEISIQWSLKTDEDKLILSQSHGTVLTSNKRPFPRYEIDKVANNGIFDFPLFDLKFSM